MIGRRAVLLAAAPFSSLGASLAAAPSPGPQVPPGGTLAFRLMRHGSEIGRHALNFETSGATLVVRATVTATVRLLSVPIVRYAHTAEEHWQDGRLMALSAETDKNGRKQWAHGARDGAGFAVQGSQTAPYVAPEPAIATTYWNRRMVAGPAISAEDGVLLRPDVTVIRNEPIADAAGGIIPADRYKLRGAFDVDVWYDQNGVWAGLSFDAADGSTVRYERL